ncbi:MAG TPA: TerC/Alx family metal homeostasis membrane protein [Kineosporiaceae bacterium]|nr:TerC/Alx family metal homeostasis membrane protein [Kineosporiaceae bacterium]
MLRRKVSPVVNQLVVNQLVVNHPVAAQSVAEQPSVGSPLLWAVTIGFVIALVIVDFLLTRRPHEVTTREAAWWSLFYISIPLGFGGFIWARFGSARGTEYLAGYVVEKSLSVDNLFVFMLLLTAFAVPVALQQRVLLYGIVGALLLRGVFIALGAAALQSFTGTFLIFGVILLVTAVKVLRDARHGGQSEVDTSRMRSVRLLTRFFPVTDGYRGTRMTVLEHGRRAITPLAVVTVAVLGTDVVFAVDSVPAVYGITGDPYLVFATNAFALLGLRALYFLLAGALSRLVHLGYGLAAILAVIGVKLVLHWAHEIWPATPQIPTLVSLALIIGILLLVTITSLLSTRTTDRLAKADGRRSEDSDRRPSTRP